MAVAGSLREVFDRIDTNVDGQLTRAELIRALLSDHELMLMLMACRTERMLAPPPKPPSAEVRAAGTVFRGRMWL